MNHLMAMIQRFGRIRQLHTIISQETIKPSFPTPPHLKTHNLSLLDQFAPNVHFPMVFFYPNYKYGDTNILKQSLSQSLTSYYPFAGRYQTPYSIECNDEGVEFLEASIDSRLNDFILNKEQDETLDQLFPNGLGCSPLNTSPNLVGIQVNYFAGGGAAVAVSILHKVADGFTIANFIKHWATIARQEPIKPCLFSSSSSNNIPIPELVLKSVDKVQYANKKFMFSNSTLSEFKNKVNAMGTTPLNPTRVEVLTSLLFKCIVGTSTRKSCSFKPLNLCQTVNMRNKIIKNHPERAAGNIFTIVYAQMEDSGEINLNEVIAKLRNERKKLEGLRDVQEVGEKLANTLAIIEGDQNHVCISTSICRFPFYEATDFGWGKPVKVTIPMPNLEKKVFMLMDTPSGDGIEALVRLPKEEIAILQKDKDLLAYV